MPVRTGEIGPTEPEVLAHTKRALFPGDNREHGYAVVDTQFATDRWLAERRVDPRITESLSPFNRVEIGTGYPDLVGVGWLDDEWVFGEPTRDHPPLIAVEAKGYREDDYVDVEQGIVQAHDRIAEANAAYLAAPQDAISAAAQSLAQDLNVGVLGVAGNGDVDVLEAPRLVGAESPTTASAIRFQTTAQGVADQSFGLNHPKNYLAYPLAVHHDGPTAELIEKYVVGAVDSARTGAGFLGLIESVPDGDVHVTPLGREVVRFALERADGSLGDALAQFDDWRRTRQRFAEQAPAWGQLTRRVLSEYPATPLLVEELQSLADDGISAPSLRQLVVHLHEHHPAFAVELFVRGTDDARERVFADENTLDREALADGNVYHSATTFQLKALLYHAGILAERGAEPHRIDPTTDCWALATPL